jgi:hypothetical protein
MIFKNLGLISQDVSRMMMLSNGAFYGGLSQQMIFSRNGT